MTAPKINPSFLWRNSPIVKDLEAQTLPQDHFRISLSDFIRIWSGFPSKSSIGKRQRLEDIFNTDYFDDYIIVTDKVSISKLRHTNFCEPSYRDGSGFIYIYTFEDNVLAGLYRQGILWWENVAYQAKLKIGRTEQHPFRRISQQLNTKTDIPEPPILLAVLWTNQVIPCERSIHTELREQGKRLADRQGKETKGGKEWFKGDPTLVLPTVWDWVKYYRVPKELLPNRVIIQEVAVYDRSILLQHSVGWVELPRPEIYSVKVRSVSHIIVRLRDSKQRCVLNCSNLRRQEISLLMQTFQEDLYLIRHGGISTYERKISKKFVA